jgi:hypothetical protein
MTTPTVRGYYTSREEANGSAAAFLAANWTVAPQAGDSLFVVVTPSAYGSGGFTPPIASSPTGWTNLTSSYASPNGAVGVFSRTADGTATDTPSGAMWQQGYTTQAFGIAFVGAATEIQPSPTSGSFAKGVISKGNPPETVSLSLDAPGTLLVSDALVWHVFASASMFIGSYMPAVSVPSGFTQRHLYNFNFDPYGGASINNYMATRVLATSNPGSITLPSRTFESTYNYGMINSTAMYFNAGGGASPPVRRGWGLTR